MKKFEQPQLEIIFFTVADILTASSGGGIPVDPTHTPGELPGDDLE